jgi:hypothetical protein
MIYYVHTVSEPLCQTKICSTFQHFTQVSIVMQDSLITLYSFNVHWFCSGPQTVSFGQPSQLFVTAKQLTLRFVKSEYMYSACIAH